MEKEEEVEIEEKEGEEKNATNINKPQPVNVIYCGVCGMPAEYCEWGPNYELCKPWLQQHCPQLHPNLFSTPSSNIQPEKEKEKQEEKPKLMPGGKTKKKKEAQVVVTRCSRSKRKYVTTVAGLENFGIKLPDAAKAISKKFACGASVTKSAIGVDEIDIQGDVKEEIVDFIIEKFGVPSDSIFFAEDGKHGK